MRTLTIQQRRQLMWDRIGCEHVVERGESIMADVGRRGQAREFRYLGEL